MQITIRGYLHQTSYACLALGSALEAPRFKLSNREYGKTSATKKGRCTPEFRQANDTYKAVADKKRWVKTFQEGDLVMTHLRKNRFPTWTYGELKSCKYGPFRITRKINDNAYVVKLPNDMLISNTFNAAEMFKYHPDDPLYGDNNSKRSFSEVEEIDVGQSVGPK
jgi:hypothetical protein